MLWGDGDSDAPDDVNESTTVFEVAFIVPLTNVALDVSKIEDFVVF